MFPNVFYNIQAVINDFFFLLKHEETVEEWNTPSAIRI